MNTAQGSELKTLVEEVKDLLETNFNFEIFIL